jgi:hypothetical protein
MSNREFIKNRFLSMWPDDTPKPTGWMEEDDGDMYAEWYESVRHLFTISVNLHQCICVYTREEWDKCKVETFNNYTAEHVAWIAEEVKAMGFQH